MGYSDGLRVKAVGPAVPDSIVRPAQPDLHIRKRLMAGRGEKKIRTVAFVSLGCPKNLVDSERMLGLLAEDGLAITADHASADAIVVNTCGFLEASKEESLAEIRRAVGMKTSGQCKRVVVAGCLVQRH